MMLRWQKAASVRFEDCIELLEREVHERVGVAKLRRMKANVKVMKGKIKVMKAKISAVLKQGGR